MIYLHRHAEGPSFSLFDSKTDRVVAKSWEPIRLSFAMRQHRNGSNMGDLVFTSLLWGISKDGKYRRKVELLVSHKDLYLFVGNNGYGAHALLHEIRGKDGEARFPYILVPDKILSPVEEIIRHDELLATRLCRGMPDACLSFASFLGLSMHGSQTIDELISLIEREGLDAIEARIDARRRLTQRVSGPVRAFYEAAVWHKVPVAVYAVTKRYNGGL